MSQGHKDWKAGDKARWRNQLVEVLERTEFKVRISIPGKGKRSVWPHGLTEVEDARESEE